MRKSFLPKSFLPTSGVQTKLVTVVLGISLATILITGLLSFGVARHLLAETGYERLAAMRSSQAVALTQYLKDLSDHVLTVSEARMTIEASREFSQAFRQLPEISDQQKNALRTYYQSEFIPRLKKRSGVEMDLAALYPQSPAERYLKYHYIAANSAVHFDITALDDAGDGSDWSRVHRKLHKRILRLAQLFDYQDMMLVDIKSGAVIYNTSKDDDLGTNLLSGPYAKTPAGQVFNEIKKSKDPFFVTFSDFTNYPPSYGHPSMFVGTTVFDGDELIAALIFQLSDERTDKIMTVNRHWKTVGMGESGETYLIGQDSTFRSSPRFFLENKPAYLDSLQKSGLASSTLKAIEAAGTPVLIQSVDTPGARGALAGKKGFETYTDYRGIPVVSAYQPIRFGPFDWGLLAEIDEAELFSGVSILTRNLLVLAAVLIPAIIFLTLRMERAFVRPIRRLLDATRKISAGDYNIHIPAETNDEFGDLATAFNTMSEKLEEREVSLQEQAEEHQRLLLSILPGSAASQLQQGTKSMAKTHPNVSVLFAEIEGWNEFSQSLPAQESIQLLSELTVALEATGERFGVEKLQSGGNRYLAVSGISSPQSDHEQRAVACCLALLDVVRSFNQTHHCDLSLSIGVNAGPLTSGVVKGQRLSYDIWGNTITIALGLHEASRQSGIQVSAPIVDALRGLYVFQPLPPMSLKGLGEIPAWSLVRPQDG